MRRIRTRLRCAFAAVKRLHSCELVFILGAVAAGDGFLEQKVCQSENPGKRFNAITFPGFLAGTRAAAAYRGRCSVRAVVSSNGGPVQRTPKCSSSRSNLGCGVADAIDREDEGKPT